MRNIKVYLRHSTDRLREWIFNNKGKICLAVGALNGVAEYIEDTQLIGTQIISNNNPIEITDATVIAVTILRFLGASGLPYAALTAIEDAGGINNLGRIIAYNITPVEQKMTRTRLLEQICENATSHEYELYRAIISLEEDKDPLKAIEYIRRSIAKAVRREYRKINGRAEHKPNLFKHAFTGISEKIKMKKIKTLEQAVASAASGMDEPHASIIEPAKYFEVLHHQISTLISIRSGKLDEADSTLEDICALEPRMTNRCVYGSFLDTVARTDDDFLEKAKSYWKELIEDIIQSPEFDRQFSKMPDSRNEVLEFADSETKRSMLIIKRAHYPDALEREYRIALFLQDLLGYKGAVPEALTFKKHGEYHYFVQKRIPGSTISETIARGDQTTTELLHNFVETLDTYQRAIQRNRGITSRYGFDIPDMDYENEFETKFVRRLPQDIQDSDMSSLRQNMQTIYHILSKQRTGGCHGDMHGRNGIVYEKGKICIIDPEKLFWGARVLDWVNLLVHTKVEQGINLDQHTELGYDVFKKRGMSMDEYLAAWHCGAVFRSAHMSGSVLKYMASGSVEQKTGKERLHKYLEQATASLCLLKELLPPRYRQAMEQLACEYSRIHQSMSP